MKRTLLYAFVLGSISAFGQLSGTYTIGASGDYSTIAAAITDLDNQGISAPVVMNIKNGTYNEQVTLPYINGSSAANTLTFQSEGGDTSLVTIEFNASGTGDNYIFLLDSALNTSFKNLTFRALNTDYSQIFEVNNKSAHISWIGNHFLAPETPQSAGDERIMIFMKNTVCNDLVVQNNYFHGASTGFLCSTSGFDYSAGITVSGNTFLNNASHAVWIGQGKNVMIENNIVLGETSDFYGGVISCVDLDSILTIRNNKADIVAKNYLASGISINPVNGNAVINISNNVLNMGAGHPLIVAGNSTSKIFHNTFVTGKADAVAFMGQFYGLEMKNNIMITADATTGPLMNAAFWNPSFGSWDIDYNAYYHAGGIQFKFSSSTYNTIADWTAGTIIHSGFDGNSKEAMADFKNGNAADGLLCTTPKAYKSPIDVSATYPLDYNGVTRGASPWMGAFECEVVTSIIEDGNTSFIEVFPNPSHDQLNFNVINLDGSNGNYTLHDVLGKQIISKSINSSGQYKIDTSTLVEGQYFLTVTIANNTKVAKVIVRH